VTFSIVATDASSGDIGVAVASRFAAVGAVVPWAKAGVGAIATQSWANTDFGPQGLALLENGTPARQALDRMVLGDSQREQRQLGIVDARGRAATFTGARCMPWSGGTSGDRFACQGNLLVGEQVVAAMADAFRRATGDLVDRLLTALLAGDANGGDRRGRQAAAVLVVRERSGYGKRNDRYIDLRVDDHPQAVSELARVFAVYDREILVRDDELLAPTRELVTEVQNRLASHRLYSGPPTGVLDDRTRLALSLFAGEFNLEERIREDDHLSGALVAELREVTNAG
jgi:uncharacterized Ntn-hydrolase superfamily protein